MEPSVAVVIVNWNKKPDVLQLLSDLDGVPEAPDVYVVDNASSDDSIPSIERAHPEVRILANKENLGGTGGFNTGIAHVCNQAKHNFIWLLDNDARVRSDTLTALIRAIESDQGIGLVGSRIVDIENKEVTVETGGYFRWDVMNVEAVNRNTTHELPILVDVDYVAICSALVRVSAIQTVGLMDDRIFLLWDDMDWGLCFRKTGFKVVCATKSIAYHGSFTERDRGLASNYYYGYRNSFLVYTKHTNLRQRTRIFYRALRNFARNYMFYKVHNKKPETTLMRKSLRDYLSNRWGKLIIADRDKKHLSDLQEPNFVSYDTSDATEVLLSVVGSSAVENDVAFQFAKTMYPDAAITVLVHADRAEYFRQYNSILIDQNKTLRFLYSLRKFNDIRKRRFDAALAVHPYPYIYAAESVTLLNGTGKIISCTKLGLLRIAGIGSSIIMAEIAAVLMLPIFLYGSLKYK